MGKAAFDGDVSGGKCPVGVLRAGGQPAGTGAAVRPVRLPGAAPGGDQGAVAQDDLAAPPGDSLKAAATVAAAHATPSEG